MYVTLSLPSSHRGLCARRSLLAFSLFSFIFLFSGCRDFLNPGNRNVSTEGAQSSVHQKPIVADEHTSGSLPTGRQYVQQRVKELLKTAWILDDQYRHYRHDEHDENVEIKNQIKKKLENTLEELKHYGFQGSTLPDALQWYEGVQRQEKDQGRAELEARNTGDATLDITLTLYDIDYLTEVLSYARPQLLAKEAVDQATPEERYIVGRITDQLNTANETLKQLMRQPKLKLKTEKEVRHAVAAALRAREAYVRLTINQLGQSERAESVIPASTLHVPPSFEVRFQQTWLQGMLSDLPENMSSTIGEAVLSPEVQPTRVNVTVVQ